MTLLLETGMRISECMALEMSDVFLKEGEIRIRLARRTLLIVESWNATPYL